MPKKLKGIHVFWPLDRSHGMANNFGQSQSGASSNPSVVSPSALPQSSTGKNHSCHKDPPPVSSSVVPSCSSSPSIVTSSSAKHKHSAHQSIGSLPTPMPMTSCLFQMQMLLLAVRPAQAQSDRRLMVHQPSYQLARNSRSLAIPSRTY